MLTRYARAVAEGRAFALAAADPTLAGRLDDDVLAALLGLRASAPDIGADAAVEAIRYGTGGGPHRTGGRLVNPTAVEAPVPPDLLALAAGAPAGPRTRLGPRPVAVFSTAGDPAQVATALDRYLDAFRAAGHDLDVLVVDDAPPQHTAALDTVLAAAGERTGYPITRLAEQDTKARLRADLVAKVAQRHGDAAAAEAVLAPGAPGSANVAFLATAGRPVLWLEQDASPRVPTGAPGPGDWSETTAPDRFVPVDVPHVVDRLLYGEPEGATASGLHADWEDTGRIPAPGPVVPGQPRLCHFHTAGHADYRARFGHNVATLAPVGVDVATALLSGDLDRWRGYHRPPDPAVVHDALSAFSTVVGLRHDLPLPAPMMAVTTVRIFDFSVGTLLRAAGDCPAAIAGTALTHERVPTTTSGRGRLAPFLAVEELLWPMQHAMTDLLAEVGPAAGGDPVDWLDRAGRHLVARAQTWRPPVVSAARAVADGLADQAVAAGRHTPPVAAHLRAVLADPHESWLDAWHHRTHRLRQELTAYGRQLRAWSALTEPDVLEAACTYSS